MVTIRALAELVGSKNVPDYRFAADPSRNYAFILCPNEVKTEELRGRYVKVGEEKIFFDVVCYAGYLCFSEDVNQQALVKKMNWICIWKHEDLKTFSYPLVILCALRFEC